MKKISQRLVLAAIIAVLAFCGAGCTKKAKEARAYQKADKYFAEGDYDSAEIEYINVLRLDRFTPRAFGQLGVIYMEQGRLSRAFAYLRQSVKLDSNNLDFHAKWGQAYLAAGSPKEARAQAMYVLERRPEDPDAPLLLADSVVTLNDDDAVRQALQKLTVPPAKRAPIEVALGSLYLREHDLKSAQDAFERARAVDPKFIPLYVPLGNLYVMQKDLKHAEEAYKFAAENSPIRSASRMKYAQFKIQNGDAAAGKKIMEEVRQKAPDYLPATIALAAVAAGEKKYDDADQLLSKVLLRDPENYQALFLSGQLGMVQGDGAKAVAQFEKLAKSYAKSPVVFYQLALAYNAAGDSAKAIENLKQALTLSPGYIEAALAMAEIKIGRGDLSSAIVTLKQLLQQHSSAMQPEFLLTSELLLGNAYRQQRDFDNAAVIFKQAEEAFPKSAQPPMLRGQVLLQMGRREEARKEFLHSLQITPGYMNALEALTDMEVGEGKYAEAMAQVQSVIQLDTNAPEPSLVVAKIELAEHDASHAAAVLQKTIDVHPDYKSAYLMLGNIYAQSGQPQKAVDTARHLLDKHPDDPAGLMLLATVMDSQTNVTAAEDAYEKLVKVSPKNSAALNNLAYLYSEHGQPDKALELARRARELLPADPATADTLGWIYYRKGDFAQAALFLQESVDKGPGSPDTQYHLGMARYMLGEEEAAHNSLLASTRWQGTFVGKDDALAALSVLAIDPKTAGADARNALEKRVAEKPGDAVALSRLAAIYKRDGNLEKAVADYEAALKANPKDLHALADLAQIYSTRPNQIGKAYALAKDANKIAPDNLAVAQLLGRLAFQAGDYKLSLSLLEDTAKKQTADAGLLYDLALASYSMGRVADAVKDARNAMQMEAGFPRAAEARRFLDMVPLADNPAQAAASAAQVDQTLKAEPDYVPALMASGVIAERKADAAAAQAAFERALARYPDFTPADRHLAVLYGQTSGNDKHKLEVAAKAYEAYPDDAEVTEALGLISYRLADYVKAARFLKESAARKSGDAQLEFYLGMSQYQLKQNTDSKQSLSRAIGMGLTDPQAADAKKVLAQLK